MRKSVFVSLALLAAAGITLTAASNQVNEPEIRSVGAEDVVQFENYTGPHRVIETASDITSIGTSMGKQVAGDLSASRVIGAGKYSVIHAVDPNEQGKLDADILLINSTATVDHVRNLRRIIAGYLSAAYGYSERDASTLATFITVYNAVYRGKLDIYQSKYKDVVTSHLTAEKCGLSTRWSDWPGNSQIVIPLGDIESGGLSSVDTSVISDQNVVDSMREDEDKGVEQRKDMVDIKERESEAAQEKADEDAQKAQEAQKEADEARQKADESAREAQQKQEAAEEARREAEEDPDNTQKREAAEEAQKEADEAQEAAEEAQKEADEAQEKAAEASRAAEESQQTADRKQAEVQEERREIARDQQQIENQAIRDASANAVYGLVITNESGLLSAMTKINSDTGETMKTSPVTMVRGRTMLPVQNPDLSGTEAESENIDTSLLYMAICGEDSKNGVVKLCLLDTTRMEIQKESVEELSASSVLVNQGSDYYVIIKDGSRYVVGKYDKSLNLRQKSPVSVNPSTPITVTQKGLVVTGANSRTLLLELSSLDTIAQDSSSPAVEK